MQFRIADTFTASLAKLTGDEQKGVKTTAFDLQLNPANPSMQLHKLDRAKDKNFWSVRAGRDIRIIVHKSSASLLLCYVDHHDKAYSWAERRKVETHPKTGAAQLVEIRERVERITVSEYVVAKPAEAVKSALFADTDDEKLLGYGVPQDWLEDVRAANEDELLDLVEHLPSEAGETLLELATGGVPQVLQPIAATTDPFDHPDAQRRFRVMANMDELQQALDYPWEKWSIFLHPAQREFVEKDYNGPARISGSAGTGKTVVALHRAAFLARNNADARILLTTFSPALANALDIKLRRLVRSQPRLAEQIEVLSINTVGERLYERAWQRPAIASEKVIPTILAESATVQDSGTRFTAHFLWAEWEQVVDAWQLRTWDAYRDVARLGRKTRLPEQQRADLWKIFEQTFAELEARGLVTHAGMFNKLAEHLSERTNPPFDFAVVDEAQDISVSQLRFLAALGTGRPNSLFFAGDLGQRIFQPPFSWKSLGVELRGRSRTLKINYRTSHQIRSHADRLLEPELADVDGNTEKRRGVVSVFNGKAPEIRGFERCEEEGAYVARYLEQLADEDVIAEEIGVFVRSEAQLERARSAVQQAGLKFKVLDQNRGGPLDAVSICTMHLAKGMEFRAVVVMACDDEILPLQARIEMIADEADLREVYDTERHLLYVACTRARDYLLVTSVEPASEFLDDLRIKHVFGISPEVS